VIEKAKLITMFERQKVVEKKAVHLAKKIVEGTKNPLVRHLVAGIILDSLKHQSYCQILVDICTGKDFLEPKSAKILKLIEIHMKQAEDMSLHLQQLIPEIDHPVINLFLREYERDELRHHNLLKQVLERMYRTRFHEEIWHHMFSPETVGKVESQS